ncbi:MAG: apolipoprotein N-acyltransferase [Ignavibacteria bacterium GWA2_55_25]|nr:MAG: apolipoprotein N-acyltransferase [Ignavibacteria bacterium GWA2_55_25]
MKRESQTPEISVGTPWHRAALAIASGAMIGFAFPPSPLYSLGYVGFIPFFLLMGTIRSGWQFLRYSYLMLFVFHVITVYWTAGYTHMKDPWLMASGTAILLAHPLFYWPGMILTWFVRKRLGLLAGLGGFMMFWISSEYLHSITEFAFPWMALGNSQAFDLYRLQLVEYTSTYGLSALLLVFNIVGFLLIANVATGTWSLRSRQSYIAMGALATLYVVPFLYGMIVIGRYDEAPPSEGIKVGVIQPNIDPWEKWGEGYSNKSVAYEKQLRALVEETEGLVNFKPDLVVWPETAIPFPILSSRNAMRWSALRTRLDSINVPVLTGLPTTVWYDSLSAPKTASRVFDSNVFYENFNSATLLIPGQEVGTIYRKVILVPFGERIPYADALSFLIEPLKWNVGIGMWGIGRDTALFVLPVNTARVPFSVMICYESVFPEYVRNFVLRGAEFLVIITNDSWWGNTSGAYQHASYASLRAIENRRWIIRAANGGISGFVDPVGRIHEKTSMYTEATVTTKIIPASVQTFYTRHGDLFAILCLFCSGLFVILALVAEKEERTDV